SGLSEPDALEIIIAATRGLVLAHEQGVIHRDIKPDNILVPQGPRDTSPKLTEAKLADLGLARSEASDGTLTMANAIMGTPGYMAPEQGMDTHTAGKPADIFSMGATFYALLTGKAPFTGTSAMQIILNTAQKPHPPITASRSDLSVPTIEIIDRCLRKEPERRFADAGEL
ncbi:MAG: serine/threonine protein kinase, partial [Phycisphaerales bacterium]|nr:serine/threonine protein kinase [Phycisphaerales bacterium]